MRKFILSFLIVSLAPALARAADEGEGADGAVTFEKHIKPILESTCVTCHNEEKDKGDIRLDTRAAALASVSENDSPTLVPGSSEKSGIYWTTVLPEDDDLIMPTKGNVLHKTQTDKIKAWIEAGAPWPEETVLEAVPRIEFVKHVQPILEQNCVVCHKPEKEEGGWEITTREAAFTTGDNGPNIVPFDPEESALYFLCALEVDDDDLMPPAKKGGPLKKKEIAMLRDWVAQGAIWPEDVTLKQRAKGETDRPPSPDDMELVRQIHAKIVATAAAGAEAEMEAYAGEIPLTGARFEMVPIPSGEFLMGSPDGEKNRRADEGPQRKVKIEPFWMGKHEVTWDEYEPFQVTPVDRYKDGARKVLPENATLVDATSQPTTPYMEMTFGMGQDGFPAISMTQHAANKYCQWLSAQTGQFYRLPTEAEWEYACRAGTTTAFSFGDDISQLGDYGWFWENSEGKYQEIGQKKPNPWGLHDMHGNVMEWVLDAYGEKVYAEPMTYHADGTVWTKPVELYNRTVRGGGWDSEPEELRSATRDASKEIWKQQDPQLPKSIWYHTDAQWLGFRIIRPLKVPTPEEMFEYWNIGRPAEDE